MSELLNNGDLMTDAEKAALERRIDELCAELGRAQLNCDMWHDRAEDMRNRLSAKKAENAKLRELCADMWLQLLNAYDYKEVDDFAGRMRELGVKEPE